MYLRQDLRRFRVGEDSPKEKFAYCNDEPQAAHGFLIFIAEREAGS
jgi:hypothetical protein